MKNITILFSALLICYQMQLSAQPCLPEGITFTTQEQIDSFQVNYPGCTEIGWHTSISGADIKNLLGLSDINSVNGNLHIWETSLTNLNGLEGLDGIGSFFIILDNPFLTSLSGLENLTIIGNDFWIVNNDSLTDLSGLISININPGLIISGNGMLSECDIQSICDYLASPNEPITIENNAPGCNSPEEVQDACDGVSIEELSIENNFTISPNPLESITLIEYTLRNNSPVTLKILDLSGREMATLVNEVQQQGEQKVTFNTAGLPAGVYFCVLKTNKGVKTKKIIKLR